MSGPKRWEASLDETSELLAEVGIKTPRELAVTSVDEVAQAAATFAGAFAIKAIAPNLAHKSDVGGVALGIRSATEARAAAAQMAAAIPSLTGFLLQEMVTGAHELFVGMRRDPVLGPFVLVGLGGLWVEVLDDVAIRPVPCDPAQAMSMLDDLRAAPLLNGHRGQVPVDRAAFADVVAAVSELAQRRPEIEQLDLNPVIIGESGAIAVDCHVVCSEPGATEHETATARRKATSDLRPMLEPRSIAVVGASADTTKVGGRLFRYLLSRGFAGPLYPVNSGAEPVLDHVAYRSVADLPETPDLACVVVPLGAVVGVVRECAQRGIPAIIVYSSGFAEAGPEGEALQEELRRIADEHGVAIGGPNTAGIVNTHLPMCASITMVFEQQTMPPGNIGVITQSGGLGSALLTRMWDRGAGISTWISCGNQVDRNLVDYMTYLVDDPRTELIVLFIEGLQDIEGFGAACRRAREVGKPVLAFKTGTSEIGRAAVASHTAALAGEDRLYDALFRSLGVVRINDLQALVDAAIALSWQPPSNGNRVAVVSTSGGACSVTADACDRVGLQLPRFTEAARDAIHAVIPSYGSPNNPIDVTLGASTHPAVVGDAVDAVIGEPYIDAVLVVLTSNTSTPALKMAQHVTEIAQHSHKPIVVARVAAEHLAPEAIALYRSHRLPVYSTPERAAAALSALVAAGGAAAPR
jgi:acyl-CoA synthetase (NDP forming)